MANTMTRTKPITEPDPFERDWWEDFYASLSEAAPFEDIEEPPLRGIGSRVRRRIRGAQKSHRQRKQAISVGVMQDRPRKDTRHKSARKLPIRK